MAGLRVPLSYASPATSRSPAPDSGPRWFATPFLYGSLIRYSMPVHPGAFTYPVFAPWLTWPIIGVQRSRATSFGRSASFASFEVCGCSMFFVLFRLAR